MPAVIKGAATMKTISRTSITSTSGVTLMSAMGAESNSESCLRSAKAIAVSFLGKLAGELHLEHADEGGEASAIGGDVAADAVVEDHGGNGGDEPERGCKQGLGDARRHDGEARVVGGGDALEGVHDAPNRAEQPDEGRDRANR